MSRTGSDAMKPIKARLVHEGNGGGRSSTIITTTTTTTTTVTVVEVDKTTNIMERTATSPSEKNETSSKVSEKEYPKTEKKTELLEDETVYFTGGSKSFKKGSFHKDNKCTAFQKATSEIVSSSRLVATSELNLKPCRFCYGFPKRP